MTPRRVPLDGRVCPGCGKATRQATRTSGEEHEPKPGHFAVCGGCGSILQFDEKLRLVRIGELPSDTSPAERVALIRLWARASTGDQHARYTFAAELTHLALRRWLARHPTEAPRFAYPEGVAIAGALCDGGRLVARNDAANMVIDMAIGFCHAAGMDAPTLMMLKIALDREGVPTEDASLADLGIIPKDAPS